MAQLRKTFLSMNAAVINGRSWVTRVRLSSFVLLAAVLLLFPAVSHAGTWVTFGPKTYTRGTGAPLTVTDTFTLLNPATQYTLKAFNGGLQDDDTELVSNCVVLLNGVQIIGPGNFNKNVEELDVPIFPQASNTLSVLVRGKAGGILAIEIVGVDNDPPTITTSLSPSPNAAGWNNSPVTVTFTCSDKTSGVASCPSPITVSTEGANQVVSGTATDFAGNTATASVTVNLDLTPPTITGSINPPPDASGYNSSAATVTFACADALSGVASCSPPVTVSNEGSFPETGTAVDVAGNTASVTITLNISFKFFKIRSWQTNPSGDPLQTGKCLDYGSQGTAGATVYLNDSSAAHAIRVVEIAPRDQKDSQGNTIPLCSTQDNPPPNPPTSHTFCHEVMLFAGKLVIAIHNPQTISLGGTAPSSQFPTEYSLELEVPWYSSRGVALSNPANQIFRLDGDSIILEGQHVDAATGNVIPGPCINTISNTALCAAPSPQLVIQVQNARGASGSPLVAAVRNLADNESWDFVPAPGSRPYPTTGFTTMIAPPGAPSTSATPITTNWQLWNAICTPQVEASTGTPNIAGSMPPQPLLDYTMTPPTAVACSPNVGWGSVVVVGGSDPTECTGNNIPAAVGACIDLSQYPPIILPAGATLRGNRRGTSFGPQLFEQLPTSPPSKPNPVYQCETCMLEVQGDYVRVTGLRMRGQSRSSDQSEPPSEGLDVDFPGQPPGSPAFLTNTLTELIATIDHNDMSDWGAAAIAVGDAYTAVDPTDNDASNQSCTFTVTGSNTSYPCGTIADETATLANVRAARNFLHHNERDNDGYGVRVGRALIEGNTFVSNRHAISGGGEPHNEYRASHNLVLSNGVNGNQDFDMHGINHPGHGYGGPGGYHVTILGNTFLGTDRQNYWLRGNPIINTDFDENVSLKDVSGAIHFVDGYDGLLGVLCCTHTYPGPPFPINLFGNQFADSTPAYTNPTAQLGVGDFDGDGNDDLFLTTGASWYYSPGGQREWRFLSAKTDRLDSLLLGDFDGDGRTDVVGMNPSGQFDVSWGGVSDWDVINMFPCANGFPNPCPTSVQNMVVGDFNGDGVPDIFYADKVHWYISYGGTAAFTLVNDSSFLVSDLRFGHFSICGSGSETDVFGIVSGKWMVTCGALGTWVPLPASLTNTINGLDVADFNGDGIADVGMPCSSGGFLGIGASPGWQISYAGTQGWSACNTFPSSFKLVGGGVGHFSGGPGADILLWDNSNGIGVFPAGTGPSRALSTQDMR